MSVEPKSLLSAEKQSEERLSALSEETMVTASESILMTEKATNLYERFMIARSLNRKWEEEEDVKISYLFNEISKEQAQKAVINEQNDLYNNEDEKHLITDKNSKSGLEEAFEEMVMVKEAYDKMVDNANKK